MSAHRALSIRSLVALFVLAVASTALGKNEFPSDWFWGDPDQRKQQDELLGQPAPKLELSHWINGDVSADDMKGKVVVASAGAAAEATVRSAGADAVKSEWLEGKRERFASIDGKPAPELTVENWMNSKTVTLADFKGKVVMLDFWATWCGPCIAAIPHTNELMEKYQDQGLVIIGVCNTRGAEKMAATAKDKGIKYPIAADVDGKTDKAYKVDSYPDYYFIDRAGNLRIADCKNGNVEDAIKALLAEPAATAAAR